MTDLDGLLIDRRRLLGTLGAGMTVAIAGCQGGDGAGDGGDDGDARSYDPNVDDHPGDAPIEFTDDQNCAVCNMTPTDYTSWHSQLAHEDGTGAVFDTPGCLFAYVVATSSDSGVAGAWTVDYESGDLVDATDAFYVLITDADAVDDPMKINPRVFADRDDAVAFVEEWEAEDLSEDDIIEFDEIDRDAAAIYRGNRI